MNPASRRRVYLWCAFPGWLIVGAIWVLQFRESTVVAFTYPILFLYLLGAFLALKFRWTGVVRIEQATFWMLTLFWFTTMGLRLGTATDPAVAWRGLSPSVFMGLTILAVMAFLWFDTGVAMVNAAILPIGSTVIGLVYFIPNPGADDALLVDFVRYEIYLAVTTVFVFALARSKDALLRTRVEADRMRAMAYRDPLTGLSNRRQALDELERIVAAGIPAGLVLLDLDEFKAVNDVHGHDVGDAVLVRVAEVLRESDARDVARWGGEEFLLLVDGGRHEAVECAHAIRQRLAAAHFPMNVTMTASFGVADIGAAPNLQELLHEVDTQLYRAKKDGRDTVRVSDPPRFA